MLIITITSVLFQVLLLLIFFSIKSSTIPAIRSNKIKIETIKSHSVLNFQQKIHPESKEKATSQKKKIKHIIKYIIIKITFKYLLVTHSVLFIEFNIILKFLL